MTCTEYYNNSTLHSLPVALIHSYLNRLSENYHFHINDVAKSIRSPIQIIGIRCSNHFQLQLQARHPVV